MGRDLLAEIAQSSQRDLLAEIGKPQPRDLLQELTTSEPIAATARANSAAAAADAEQRRNADPADVYKSDPEGRAFDSLIEQFVAQNPDASPQDVMAYSADLSKNQFGGAYALDPASIEKSLSARADLRQRGVRQSPIQVIGGKSLSEEGVSGPVNVDQLEAENRPTLAQSIGKGAVTTRQLFSQAAGAVGEAAGSEDLAQWGNERAQIYSEIAAAMPKGVELSRIDSLTDALQWAKQTVGEQGSLMAAPVAGGLVGGAIKGSVGAAIGAFAPSYGLALGEIAGQNKQADPDATAGLATFTGAAAVAALDSITPGKFGTALVRRFGQDEAEQIAERALFLPMNERLMAAVRSVGGTAGTTAAREGWTEGTQQVVGELASAVETGKPITPGLLGRSLEAAVTGGFMGGVIGAGQGVMTSARRPSVPGIIETANVESDPTPEDEASPLPTDLIAQGKALMQGAQAQREADSILSRNNAPPTGTRVAFMGQQGTIEDSFTDENGEDGVTISVGGQKQKVYFSDLADAGVVLEPVAEASESSREELGAQPQISAGLPAESAREELGAGEQLKARIRQVESGGNDAADNPNSTASGRYQFTNGTFVAYYRKVFGTEPPEGAKNDPAVQERLMDALVSDNEAALKGAGFEPTAGNLYLAHFLGAKGALAVLRNPNGSAEGILGRSVADANGTIIRGKTGAEVAAWAAEKMGSPVGLNVNASAPAVAPAAEETAGVDFLKDEPAAVDTSPSLMTDQPAAAPAEPTLADMLAQEEAKATPQETPPPVSDAAFIDMPEPQRRAPAFDVPAIQTDGRVQPKQQETETAATQSAPPAATPRTDRDPGNAQAPQTQALTSADFTEIDASGNRISSPDITSRAIARVEAAIAAGNAVTLYADGKPIPIISVSNGALLDGQGQRWGTMSIATDNTGENRIEIEPAAISSPAAGPSQGAGGLGESPAPVFEEAAAPVEEQIAPLEAEAAPIDALPAEEPRDRRIDAAAEEAFAREWTDARPDLRARLKGLGLSDKVQLELVDKLANPVTKEPDARVAGRYHRRVITVALRSVQDPATTLDHEAVHGLRDLGLIKDAEWRTLVRAARADTALMDSVRERYAEQGLSEDVMAEEAIADLFARWSAGDYKVRGFERDAFQRIKDFLAQLGEWLRLNFTDAEGVLRAIESGEIGGRTQAAEAGAEKFSMAPALPRASNEDVVDTDGAAAPPSTTETSGSDGGGWKDAVWEVSDRWRTNFQDRMLPILRTQASVEKLIGRQLSEEEQPYRQEALHSGRTGAQLEQLADKLVDPLFAAMQAENISPGELESYLMARHAPERNAYIATINPEFASGGGSGMTDLEAKAIISRIRKADRLDAFKRVAERVDAIIGFSLDTRVESGLLSQDDADALRARWKYYVPLRGHAEIDGEARPDRGGRGLTVRGAESQRAFGRRSKAEDILAFTILQAEEAIVRSEKNRVGQELYNLAKASPDENFWKIAKVEVSREINPETGLVEMVVKNNPPPSDADYTVDLKIGGKPKRVTFNKNNPAAVRAAAAMRRTNEPELNFRVLQLVNQWLSKANTALNPDFIFRNAFRDLQTAIANSSEFELKGFRRAVVADYRKALIASTKGAFKKEDDSEWAKMWNEFTAEGGRVYYNQIQDVGTLRTEIERRMMRSQEKRLGTKAAGMALWDALKWSFDKIEKANLGVENAARLSVYKNLRERGVSKKEAAFRAKEITVNFNRRGVYGVLMNSLYLFYNASIQGNMRMMLAMKHRKTQKLAAAMVATGAMSAIFNVLASGVDDDDELFYDKVSDHDKATNLIFMLPGSDKMIKVAIPYGYNIFFELGRHMVDVGRGRETPMEAAGNWLFTAINSFNPIGGQESVANLIAPTIFDPVIDLQVDNKDFANKPILPPQPQYGPEVPDSLRFFPGVNPLFRTMTDALREATGGDDVVAGSIDVSPETLEYMTSYITGAAGATVMRSGGAVVKALDGDPDTAFRMSDVPILRSVAGEKPGWYDKSAFYARLKDIEKATSEADDYDDIGDAAGLSRLLDRRGDVLGLEAAAKDARREMKAIRKDKASIELDHDEGAVDDATYKTEMRALLDEEAAIISAFNKEYIASVKKPIGPE